MHTTYKGDYAGTIIFTEGLIHHKVILYALSDRVSARRHSAFDQGESVPVSSLPPECIQNGTPQEVPQLSPPVGAYFDIFNLILYACVRLNECNANVC